jgi:hypothetical protein
VNKCPTQAIEWKYNRDLSEAELLAQRKITNEEENPDTISSKRSEKDGERKAERETRTRPVNIRIMKDGPVVVDGKFLVIGPDDEPLKTALMTSFCRCGNSRSQPYCDGTHRKIGFTDSSQ